MRYRIEVRFSSMMIRFYLDDFLARHFANYTICEYAKNENGYSVCLSNSFETTDLSKAITEIAEILDQENSFNIVVYEQMPETPSSFYREKAKDDELESTLKKAGIVADLIIEKAEREKEKASKL